MLSWLIRKITKNYSEVPLFWVTFNLNKYKNEGVKNSCILSLHPELKNDEYIRNTLNDLVDYIRGSYDMNKISK
jgi:hypothetical protein